MEINVLLAKGKTLSEGRVAIVGLTNGFFSRWYEGNKSPFFNLSGVFVLRHGSDG